MTEAGPASNSAQPNNPYPLPESLTRRLLVYLSFYRLVIALLLVASNFSLADPSQIFAFSQSLPSLILAGYALFSAIELFIAFRTGLNAHRLTLYELPIDIAFLSVLVFALNGLGSGVGILLVFASGLAGLLLPLRLALFLAAVAALSMIGHAVYSWLLPDASMQDILRAAQG